MLDRILPFLSQLIPPYLAMKGLGKVDPRLASFFSGALGTGYTVDQSLDFLRDKLTPSGRVAEENRLEQGEQQGTLRPDEAAAHEKMKQRAVPQQVAQKAIAIGAGGIGGQIAKSMTPKTPIAKALPSAIAQPRAQQKTASNAIAQYSPELDNFVSSNIYRGMPPPDVANKARSASKFKKVVSQIENESGLSFDEIVTGIYGNPMQQGQQGQNQPSQGQSSQGKQSLLQSMQGITQTLQNLKGNK